MKYFGFWNQISTHTSKAHIKAEPKEKNEMLRLYRLQWKWRWGGNYF
jgi:hypothetical protein